ncbi:unnamed protein product [Hanseniaspora opuntiae]
MPISAKIYTTLEKLDERTKHLANDTEKHTTDNSSNKSQYSLNPKYLSLLQPWEPSIISINENLVPKNVLTAETLISAIKYFDDWEDDQLNDEERIPSIHQKLVDCTNVIEEPFVVTSDHKPITARDAIKIFSKQLTEMKAAGHLDSFIINPNEAIFTKHNTNEVFEKLYQTMAKVSKELDCFHLVPIAFSVACLHTAGGFDFSDSKTDLNWIINSVDGSETIPTHPSFKFICLSKNSGDILTLNSIIDGTPEAIHQRYERHNLKKTRFNKEDKYWIEKPILDNLDKLAGDLTNSPEKMAIMNEIKQELDGKNRMMVDADISVWVSQLKYAVYDENIRPKMNELWVQFNEQINQNPTQDFKPWIKSFLGKYTDLSKPLKKAQIYKLMQTSFKQANDTPWFCTPKFEVPNDYLLNTVANNSNKGKKKRYKKPQKPPTGQVKD